MEECMCTHVVYVHSNETSKTYTVDTLGGELSEHSNHSYGIGKHGSPKYDVNLKAPFNTFNNRYCINASRITHPERKSIMDLNKNSMNCYPP